MVRYQVGIIGCGRPRKESGSTGYGMAHLHMGGYAASPKAQLVALADISLENARAFQEEHGGDRLYADYHEMLEKESLDIVSICTWPHLHAEMVIAAAEAGVKAIHCEKPMAPTYGEARRMTEVCAQRGVQLSFNHQRRFGAPFRMAKELAKAGAIGELERLEGSCSNLYDWGTHWFDMMCYYNDDTPVKWVMGQIDASEGTRVFGVPIEGQGMSQFRFANGVVGLLLTGEENPFRASNRLVGSDGVIEVGARDGAVLRYWGKGQSSWCVPEVDGGMHGVELVKAAVLDVIAALDERREPELSARRALRATELIFGTYESSRRRARVEFPLDLDDSPLLSMLQSGVLEADWL